MNDGLAIRNSVRMEVLRRFRAEGISMPYPHQDVMLHLSDSDRSALLRRKRGKEAGQKPNESELHDGTDDDKLLP